MRRFYKWSGKIVNPKKVLSEIRPGMSVFLGTGVAEPRTLVQRLLASTDDNIQDLELIQLVSLGDAIANEKLNDGRFRLKTFFSGWVAHDAITRGHVDLIP
ncbi:MAG: GNAT family N-acetyltransferase, partial [Desulfatibacillaceae bacterium]|nr:GNAT family N-acetyltransferase [Desulfatibacillaceae bacterium]